MTYRVENEPALGDETITMSIFRGPGLFKYACSVSIREEHREYQEKTILTLLEQAYAAGIEEGKSQIRKALGCK